MGFCSNSISWYFSSTSLSLNELLCWFLSDTMRTSRTSKHMNAPIVTWTMCHQLKKFQHVMVIMLLYSGLVQKGIYLRRHPSICSSFGSHHTCLCFHSRHSKITDLNNLKKEVFSNKACTMRTVIMRNF